MHARLILLQPSPGVLHSAPPSPLFTDCQIKNVSAERTHDRRGNIITVRTTSALDFYNSISPHIPHRL